MHALYRNHMGSDLEVVNDARISFSATTRAKSWDLKEIPNRCDLATNTHAKIPELNGSDKSLIGFLARGCRSGEWEDALDRLNDSMITLKEIRELMAWVKRMPTHWTPFGQQTVKLRMKAPIPIRTQC